MPSTTYQPSSQATTASTSNYVSSKNLPHLPKGMRVPKSHATDNKPLPSNEWLEEENAQQMQLMAPGQQGGSGGGRRELQPFHAGASRSNQQSQDVEPPPIFASQPKRGITLKRPTKVQQQIYRMSGGIEPVDLLCNRLQVWRLAIKDLNELFKNIIDVESKAANGYATANKPLEIPFRESYNQFLHSGGVQDVWVAYRNYTMEKSMMHHEYAGYLKSAVLPSLDNIQKDVRNFIKSIEKDPSLRSSMLYNSRQEADAMVNQLDNGIKYVHHTPDRVTATEDPTLLNLGVIQSFRTLYNDENNLHENVIQLQREAATVEQRIFGSLNIITKNWEDFCIEHRIDSKTLVGKVTSTFENIKTNSDWNEFVRRNQFQLVNEKATYKTDDDLKYPNQNNNLCIPVKVNFLNRKTAFKKWKEGLYVLTPCGYLHGFKNAKHFETDPLSPEISIFLPSTAVSSTDEQAEDLSFQIAGRKRALGGQKAFIFQANDESDLADWYAEAQRLSQVNAEHDVMEMENVPPALPGMEPHEREEEYATNGVIGVGGGSGRRMIEDGDGKETTNVEEHSSSEDEDTADNNNLSTAAVLPDTMATSSSTPRLQRKQAKSPLSNQVHSGSPSGSGNPTAAVDQQTRSTTLDSAQQQQQNTGEYGISTDYGQKHAINGDQTSAGDDRLQENDFIERYNDKLTMADDDDNTGARV